MGSAVRGRDGPVPNHAEDNWSDPAGAVRRVRGTIADVKRYPGDSRNVDPAAKRPMEPLRGSRRRPRKRNGPAGKPAGPFLALARYPIWVVRSGRTTTTTRSSPGWCQGYSSTPMYFFAMLLMKARSGSGSTRSTVPRISR